VLTLVSGILRSAFGLRNVKTNDALKARTSCVLGEVDMAELDYKIETEQEEDGRWIAEVVGLPGVLAYGSSKQEAIANVEAIAFRVIADRIDDSKIATSRVSFGSA
jgi:predicted RNase H-like HicB family nuclease